MRGVFLNKEIIDTGSFDEMVTLASERALADGGRVIIHKDWCEEGDDSCLCQPQIVAPYTPVEETDFNVTQ